MRKGIVDINNKYTKIMLLAILIIASILSVYLVTNTNKKAFNANIINQKASNAVREVVNIPDQDLKNFLLTNFKNANGRRIGLTEGNYVKPSDENEIYKDEMEKITSINAYGINTKQTPLDLTGLETAVNIQEQLNLDYNKIENLEPLRGLTNLIELSLKGNKIENIEPLKGLTSLTNLWMQYNKIENIDSLKGLINLRILYLSSNKIENIDSLKGLINLTSLELQENKIENLEPLKGLINLTSLNLRKNKIENLEPLKGLTNLTSLELQENKIENIDALKQLINLKILIIHTNKIKNIEPVRGLINLTYLYIAVNKIENVEPLRGLINLRTLRISTNKIENLEPIKELTNLPELYVDTEEINISPNTNKFNLPVLKKYNGEILDIVQASNGLLKKNTDGTYSFTRKVTGVQTVNVGKGIANKDPKVDANWNTGYPIYILKIDPTNIADEKVSITKAVKDKSNTLLNNDKETKVLPVIKRNGQVITHANTNNVGHRANNDELLTYTWNELPKFDDTYTDYNYEVTFDISGLPEGYSINPNTKTTDNQADFNITYVSQKITVTKDIAVNGGDKTKLPNEITVTISNDKGLPEKEAKATLKPDKSGYVVNENLDKTNSRGENVTYTVVPKTDLPNYIKTSDTYTYVSPKVNVTVEKNWVNGETVRPETITAKLKRKIVSDNTYTFVQDVTVRKDNNWQLVVANLDKTDANGNDYTYIVEEETNVDNFTPSYSGLIVTNTYASPKKQLDLRVEVIGGDKNTLPNEVEVEILDKTDENNKIVVKKVKLSLNQDKTAYVGTEEVNTTKPDGTNIIYGRNTVTDIDSLRYIRNNDGNYVYTPNIINVSGNVTYVNGNTLWEEIHVKLYKNGQEVPNSEKVLTKESFLNSVNGNKSTLPVEYTGLNETENDGSLNTYEIKAETNVNLFTKTVTGNNTTYTFASETKQIPYNITYKDGDANNRPEVTVILKKKNNDTSAVTEVTRKTNTANNKNSVVFENIPSKDEKGRDNEYTFEITVPKNSNYVVENNNGNYVVKYVSPKITFTAGKEWVNGPANKPEIKIGLLRDGNSLGDNFVKIVVTEKNKTNVSVSWENLDKTDANGVDYVYSISEIGEVENYQRRYEGNNKVVNTYVSPKTEVGINVNKNGGKATKAKVKLLKNGVEVPNTLKEITLNTKVTYPNIDKTDTNGNDNHYEIVLAEEVTNYVPSKDNSGNITLTYVSPKVKLTVEKQWIDGENLVPESITAALRRQEGINLVEAYTFELKKSENWTKEVEVDETDFQGDKYEYHLAEKTKVENFTDVVKGLRITNVYRVPKQELTLTKIWNGGKTRENVTLELKKADGTKVDEKKTTKVDENTFKAVFNNVDKTELNGSKINFKADEKETFENYVKSVNGLTVTNTYVSPKINVSKIVKIEVPKEVFKKTTKTIEVQLYKNGKPVGETKVINVDDIDENGKVVVNYPDMDKTDFDGNNYDYDVKLAKQIDGYKEKGQDEMTIEKDIETEDKEVSVEFSGGKLRPNVVVELLRDGKVIKTETVTNNKHVFKNIELNDKFAHEYKYKIRVKNESELNNKNYKVNIETNANMKKAKVTLTYVIPKIDLPINILWQGKGKNNPTVKIQLLKNGVPTDKVVELNGNGEYIFRDLDKTDFSGNEYEYKISVVGEIPGYYYELTPNGKSLIVTRNDLKGKVLPYAGLKENMTMSYVVLAVLIAGFVYSNKAKRNINKLENISDIRRNNLRRK